MNSLQRSLFQRSSYFTQQARLFTGTAKKTPAPPVPVQVEVKATPNKRFTSKEALDYHEFPEPGKFVIQSTKPMNNQRDLSLAYSPGVAAPCLEIFKDEEKAYDYTNKGNMVAVVSNGTAVLGLGNLGALAGKPVMEGKAVLFNKFAGVQSVDICVDAIDKDAFINCVRYLGPSFGGINLEDIKGPDCFYIEEKLKSLMKIPVFHDDQHGTAIICLAGLINASEMSGKKFSDLKVVVNGAGAAGIACLNLIKAYGAHPENCMMVDTKGIIYHGRKEGMNKWKEMQAVDTDKRTLTEALDGADVFIGVSAKGALTKDMLLKMNHDPIIFAMANPDPEILPEEATSVRADAIVATGRSDYPN
jgi:malate dehydrogenase (oxaloacetate-decarboxylating)(NADP+)